MFFLKATDQETFEAALVEAGWLVEEVLSDHDGTVINPREQQFYTSGHSLDVIGTYQRQIGSNTDSDGLEIPIFEDVDGYHANLLLHGDVMPDSIWPFVLDGKDGRDNPPSTPVRLFA